MDLFYPPAVVRTRRDLPDCRLDSAQIVSSIQPDDAERSAQRESFPTSFGLVCNQPHVGPVVEHLKNIKTRQSTSRQLSERYVSVWSSGWRS